MNINTIFLAYGHENIYPQRKSRGEKKGQVPDPLLKKSAYQFSDI